MSCVVCLLSSDQIGSEPDSFVAARRASLIDLALQKRVLSDCLGLDLTMKFP